MTDTLDIVFDGGSVSAKWKADFGVDHFASAARMLLGAAIRAAGRCGCAGCAATVPHFEAALAEMIAAETAAVVAQGNAVPTVSDVGRA